MPIAVSCPSCGVHMHAPDDTAGKKVRCPKCQQVVGVPTAPVAELIAEAPPPLPRRERDDDYDQLPRRRRRRDHGDDEYEEDRSDGWRCPFCRERSRMVQGSRISSAGWVTFVVLLIFCFPLFWIGLLIKEPYNSCASCGAKLGA